MDEGGKPGGGETREGEGKGSGNAETWDLGGRMTLGRMGGSEGGFLVSNEGRGGEHFKEQDKVDVSKGTPTTGGT